MNCGSRTGMKDRGGLNKVPLQHNYSQAVTTAEITPGFLIT